MSLDQESGLGEEGAKFGLPGRLLRPVSMVGFGAEISGAHQCPSLGVAGNGLGLSQCPLILTSSCSWYVREVMRTTCGPRQLRGCVPSPQFLSFPAACRNEWTQRMKPWRKRGLGPGVLAWRITTLERTALAMLGGSGPTHGAWHKRHGWSLFMSLFLLGFGSPTPEETRSP